MPAAEKEPSPQYRAFAADTLARLPDVAEGSMFGMRCLKLGGKAFAGGYAGGVTFKLPPGRREQALALAGAVLFDPAGKGRPMKEWVVVPAEHSERWDDLADDAAGYVRADQRRRAAGSGRP